MGSVIACVLDAMWRESRLPNFKAESKLVLRTIRETSFYTLHCFLERNLCCGRKNAMKVVWHDYEFLEEESVLAPVLAKDV